MATTPTKRPLELKDFEFEDPDSTASKTTPVEELRTLRSELLL